jgi:hypothetical protein
MGGTYEGVDPIFILTAQSNLPKYKVTLDAVRAYGPISPIQVSELTNRTEKKERKFLKKLTDAGLLKVENGLYSVKESSIGVIEKEFGAVLPYVKQFPITTTDGLKVREDMEKLKKSEKSSQP